MLDLKAIREDPEPYRRAMARRGVSEELDRALALDEERRRLTVQVDELRAEQNRGSKEVAAAENPEEGQAVIERLRSVSEALGTVEPKLARLEDALNDVMARLPNVPEEAVPEGQSEDDNVEVKRWGEPHPLGFEPRDHVELGEVLGMIDIERGVRTSGARFAYLTGPAVRIQFALVQLGLEFAEARGFVPVVPPVLVREEAMFGTGFFPTEAVNIYATREDDLYLIGTSEVPLAAFHAHEILEQDGLPRRYVGYSTCFRREAGTYGKDTRGIFRVHQFDKLEMFSFVTPGSSVAEHERFLAFEEEWVQALGIPYRVVDTCIGDLGASASRKFDIEAWMPGEGRYREITSTSNTTDYQARRLEIRVRLPEGNRPVHTVNGTLCAIGRTLIALLENAQREDGSVLLPEVLRAYLPEPLWILQPSA
ncbi:MAG TPA: serine--tRNA ligase [Actinomycetota bacterium]|nr:serine--tRNA ligase [Actinomycetota bacterium]